MSYKARETMACNELIGIFSASFKVHTSSSTTQSKYHDSFNNMRTFFMKRGQRLISGQTNEIYDIQTVNIYIYASF